MKHKIRKCMRLHNQKLMQGTLGFSELHYDLNVVSDSVNKSLRYVPGFSRSFSSRASGHYLATCSQRK